MDSNEFPFKPGQVMTGEELREIIPKYIHQMPIDDEIKPQIVVLNKAGYITLECCAGHDGGRGYIEFMDQFNKDQIGQLKSLLRLMGFKNCMVEDCIEGEGTVVTFNSYT